MRAKVWAVISNRLALAVGLARRGLRGPTGCQQERRRRKRGAASLALGRLPADWSHGAVDCDAPGTVPSPHVGRLEATLRGDLGKRHVASSRNPLRKQGSVFKAVPFVLQALSLQLPPRCRPKVTVLCTSGRLSIGSLLPRRLLALVSLLP